MILNCIKYWKKSTDIQYYLFFPDIEVNERCDFVAMFPDRLKFRRDWSTWKYFNKKEYLDPNKFNMLTTRVIEFDTALKAVEAYLSILDE